MSRVRGLTTEQKIKQQATDLVKFCSDKMATHEPKITQQDLADYMGITQPAVAQQFKNKKISLELFIAVIQMTDPEGSTKLRAMIK